MTIQEFGNAFKAQINTRKGEVHTGGVADFFANTHNYALGESTVIDTFFNDDGTDKSQLTNNNLRAAAGAGTDDGTAAGAVENWSDASVLTDEMAGEILGKIYDLGINEDEIELNGNNIAIDDGGTKISGSKSIIN